MKNLKYFTLFVFLYFVFTVSSNAGSNCCIIKIKRPPINQLGVADLYNLELTNPSNEQVEFYLYGTLNESKAGLIATATTVPITLAPGEKKQLKINDLPKTPDVSYPNADNRYKEALMRKGSLPDGNYTICITVKQTGTNEELGYDCIEQEVSIQTEMEISLLTPDNKAKIESDEPVVFSWLPLGTVTTTATGAYKIKIVEIIRDESPETAILKNKAFFEKEGIKNTIFQYPSSAPKFVTGKKYAWQVSMGNTLSPVSIFDRWGNLLTLVSPKNGELVDGDSVIFEWGLNIGLGTVTATPTQAGYRIKIVEIKGDESPENAILKNKAFFEKEGIKLQMFQYPSSAPKLIPGNNYAWAIQVGDWQSDGAFFQVAGVLSGTVSGPAGPLLVISPKDGELVNGDSVVFSWEVNNSGGVNNTDALSYKIKIVEIKGDESPENAIIKNKAFFEKEGIRNTMFQYPSSAPKFIAGNKYAWQVSDGSSESAPKTLTVTGAVNPTGGITETTDGDSVMPAKVSFKMKRPPLNTLLISDTYTGATTINQGIVTLYLYSTITNIETGEIIATIQSNPFDIKSGSEMQLTDLIGTPIIKFLSKDKKYESFRSKGNAPLGNYNVCVELRYANNSVAAQDCFNQTIE